MLILWPHLYESCLLLPILPSDMHLLTLLTGSLLRCGYFWRKCDSKHLEIIASVYTSRYRRPNLRPIATKPPEIYQYLLQHPFMKFR